jgi:hypothetical protein
MRGLFYINLYNLFLTCLFASFNYQATITPLVSPSITLL